MTKKDWPRVCVDCDIIFKGGFRAKYCAECKLNHVRGSDKNPRKKQSKHE